MERRYDIAHSVILVLFLVVASFISNSIVKGILLLLFSAVLIFNTVTKLKMKKDDKIRGRIFYAVLLFLDSILALASLYVVITAIIEAI